MRRNSYRKDSYSRDDRIYEDDYGNTYNEPAVKKANLK